MGIVIDKLHFSYGNKEVLKGFSMTANYGEFVYVLGPNGVGKSTLFRCMLGYLKPSSGNVLINGKPISSHNISELSKVIAYIPQSYTPTFNYTVLQTVTMGRTAHLSLFSSPSKSDYEKSKNIMKKLGIYDLTDSGIAEISGGERQMVLIARALVQDAKILIMDEPTSNLDYGNQLRIQAQMRDLAHEGMLVLLSSHNPQYAMQFADRIVAINNGVNVAHGKPNEIITSNLLKQLYGLEVEVQNGFLLPTLT
jgi:iron complex transport system ATP-binding protein